MNIDVYVHEYQYAFLGEYLDTLIIRHKFEYMYIDADIKIVERDRTTDTDKCKAQAKYTGRDRYTHANRWRGKWADEQLDAQIDAVVC